MAQWFYQTAQRQQSGPIDSKELRRLAESGIVTPNTLVRKGDSGGWVRAEQVRGLFQPLTPAPSSAPMVKATLVQPPVPPPLPSAIRESRAPSGSVGGESPIRHGSSASAVNEASEKRNRIHPSTLVAIIASTGFVLLLLWTIAFRGGGEQHQAENDQPSSIVAKSTESSAPTLQPLAQRGSEIPAPLDMDDRRGAMDAEQHQADANEEFSASELYERASPCSLRVENYDRNGKLAASGSGFLVSPDGQVVTNLHVIRGADTVTVRLSSGTTTAVRGVLCLDEAHDIAVLDIGGTGHDYLQLSKLKPSVGTRVYAIGNPLGLTGTLNTLSDGVVSNLPDFDGVQYVQTTAAISPGSSGGPLLAANGTVIGITTASLRGGQNLNLAIPASAISSLLNEHQQPLTLAQVNAKIGTENQQITTEDDAVKLAEIWDAIRANKTGDALRMLAAVPNERRGTGYWIASGHLHFRLGNFDDAQAAFRKAVANDPNNTESLLRLALALRFDANQRSWDAPKDLCKRVIQLDPTNIPAYIIGGMCMMPGEDVRYFKTAAALDPDNFDAQYNLSIAMHYDLALKKDRWEPLQKALELEECINLADYVVRDQQLEPVWHLTRLPTTKSLKVPLKLALAKAYIDGEHYERAIQQYKQVLKIEPNNPVAPWGLCFTYRGYRGDFKHPDALEWERRAKGTDFMPATFTQKYMPTIVYNYFGMLR